MVHWLGFCVFAEEGMGSTPGWGAKIQYAAWGGKKIKEKFFLKVIKDLNKVDL